MPNMSYMARDSVHETKGATRDAGKAASAAAGDIQHDLLALRDNAAKLTLQITAIVAAAAAQPGAGRDRTSNARSPRRRTRASKPSMRCGRSARTWSTHSTSRSRSGPTRLWGSRSGQDFCSPRRGGDSP